MIALLLQTVPAAGGITGGNPLLWAVVLLAGAFVLFSLEILLPSGGLLGLAAGVAAIAAVGCFFAEDTALGFASLLGLAVVTPVLIGVGLKIWPHTPIGRRLVLGGMSNGDDQGVPAPATPGPGVGDTGEAVTPLRRIGTCRFDGVRVECLAESGMIEAGATVVVRRVSGNEVFVRESPPASPR